MPIISKAFNLSKHKIASLWSAEIAKEEYNENNFIIHNNQRGIFCTYIPASVVSEIEKIKRPGRWIMHLLHGIYPDFIFTTKCKKLGYATENSQRPDKKNAKDLVITLCKKEFEKGKFEPTDADVINAPSSKYSFNLKKHKKAVHGLSPFNYNDADNYRGSWAPVSPSSSPYSPSLYVTHVPNFGGGTYSKERGMFNNLSNGNNTNDEPDMKNTRHTDPLTDYNEIWKANKLNKERDSRMGKSSPESWELIAPAGKDPHKAIKMLKEKFPGITATVDKGEIKIIVNDFKMSLNLEKYLSNVRKMKL